MHRCLRHDVGVQAIAQIDRINVVTRERRRLAREFMEDVVVVRWTRLSPGAGLQNGGDSQTSNVYIPF